MKILLIVIILIKILSSEINFQRNLEGKDCSSYSDCFNCSVCGVTLVDKCPCEWHSGKCNRIYYSNNFNYENCVDLSSSIIQQKYCGNFIEDEKKMILSFPKINGYYGQTNLFCLYRFENQKPNSKLRIEVKIDDKKYSLMDKIIFTMFIKFSSGDKDLKTLLTGRTFIEDYIDFIQFSITSQTLYSENPFTVTITNLDKKFSVGLIFLIIGVIVFYILCSIIIYYFSHKYERRRGNDGHVMNRIFVINQYSQYNEDVNINKIEKMLKDPNQLGERICESKHEKYGNNCTICLEHLKIGVDKISLTPCQHVFHYKCLSNWLRNKDTTYKCPVCNCNILEYQNNNFSDDKNPQFVNNNDNNSDNNNNLGEIMSLRGRSRENQTNNNH